MSCGSWGKIRIGDVKVGKGEERAAGASADTLAVHPTYTAAVSEGAAWQSYSASIAVVGASVSAHGCPLVCAPGWIVGSALQRTFLTL